MSVARERLDDLLVQRATEGLDLGQAAELDRLLGEHPQVDPHSFDRAAAALHLACLRGKTPPLELRDKLAAAARRFAQDRR